MEGNDISTPEECRGVAWTATPASTANRAHEQPRLTIIHGTPPVLAIRPQWSNTTTPCARRPTNRGQLELVNSSRKLGKIKRLGLVECKESIGDTPSAFPNGGPVDAFAACSAGTKWGGGLMLLRPWSLRLSLARLAHQALALPEAALPAPSAGAGLSCDHSFAPPAALR
jgi:hypothetical protein